jgi:hypothetical protein
MSEVISVNEQTGVVVLTATDVKAISGAEAGQPEGVATLDSSGRLPEAQLPSSVVSSPADPSASGEIPVSEGSSSRAVAFKTPAELGLDIQPSALEPVVYVSLQGSDINTGLTRGAAFRTIHKALEYVKATEAKTGKVNVGYGVFTEKALVRPIGCWIDGEGPSLTEVVQEAGQNANTIQDECWGKPGEVGMGGGLRGLTINGNKNGQTTSYAVTIVKTVVSMVIGTEYTVEVSQTNNFPENGYLWFGTHLVKYSGKTSTTFTGVTPVYDAFSTNAEMLVEPFGSWGHGIACQSPKTLIENVIVKNTIGSSACFQGSGTAANGQYTYQCKLNNIETEQAYRWGLQIMGGASDSHVTNWVGGANAAGEMLYFGGDWEFVNCHPIGDSAYNGALAPAMFVIGGSYLQMKNMTLDSAPYDTILWTSAPSGVAPTSVDIEGQLLKPSGASANAGAGMTFYGGVGYSKARRLRVVLDCIGHISNAIAPYPYTYLVGVQNLNSPSGSKVQVLNALPFSPLGSSVAGNITIGTGGSFPYTGKTSFGAQLAEAAAKEATKLKLTSTSGIAASGTITASVNTESEGVAALRIKYTGVSGNELTGVTGVTEALPAGTGVAQHFLTGVGSGSGRGEAVPDNTPLFQEGRLLKEVDGVMELRTAENGTPAPNALTQTSGSYVPEPGLRISGQIAGHSNPFKGQVEVAVGETEGKIAHHLQAEPTAGHYSAAPAGGDPQQRYWVTVDATYVRVHVASAIVATAVKFNVEAQITGA